MACDLSFIVKNERILKVTGSYIDLTVVLSLKWC